MVKANSMKAYERVKAEEVKRKQIELDNGTYEIWNLEHFFKGNLLEIRAIMQELNVWERSFLFTIAPYVGYEDCCLKYDNGKELSFDKMVEITGISKGKLSETIKGLIKKDIIYKGKNSKNVQYFVNPWLFSKGNRINSVLKTMFKNYEIRTRENKRWKDLKDEI